MTSLPGLPENNRTLPLAGEWIFDGVLGNLVSAADDNLVIEWRLASQDGIQATLSIDDGGVVITDPATKAFRVTFRPPAEMLPDIYFYEVWYSREGDGEDVFAGGTINAVESLKRLYPSSAADFHFSAITLVGNKPVLSSALMSQVAFLVAVGLTSGLPSFGIPALIGEGFFELIASNLDLGAPDFGLPGMYQLAFFSAPGITTGTPVLSGPPLSEGDQFSAVGITAGAPTLSAPAVVQRQALTPAALTTGAATIGTSAFLQQQALIAAPLTTPAVSRGTPAVTQRHALVSFALATGAPSMGAPVLTSGVPAEDHLDDAVLIDGHSLASSPLNDFVDQLMVDAGGTPAIQYVSIPGSSMNYRITASPNWDELEEGTTDILVITEAGPIGRPDYMVAGTFVDALAWFNQCATYNPDARQVLYQIWTSHDLSAWNRYGEGSGVSDLPLWRRQQIEDEYRWDAIQDHVNANKPGGTVPYEQMKVGSAWGVLWDACVDGDLPGVTTATFADLFFSDTIHFTAYHASIAPTETSYGAYFVACCCYAAITKLSPVGRENEMVGLFEETFPGHVNAPPALAAKLQAVAGEVVLTDPRMEIKTPTAPRVTYAGWVIGKGLNSPTTPGINTPLFARSFVIGYPRPTISYSWRVNGTQVATGPSFTPAIGHVGGTLTLRAFDSVSGAEKISAGQVIAAKPGPQQHIWNSNMLGTTLGVLTEPKFDPKLPDSWTFEKNTGGLTFEIWEVGEASVDVGGGLTETMPYIEFAVAGTTSSHTWVPIIRIGDLYTDLGLIRVSPGESYYASCYFQVTHGTVSASMGLEIGTAAFQESYGSASSASTPTLIGVGLTVSTGNTTVLAAISLNNVSGNGQVHDFRFRIYGPAIQFGTQRNGFVGTYPQAYAPVPNLPHGGVGAVPAPTLTWNTSGAPTDLSPEIGWVLDGAATADEIEFEIDDTAGFTSTVNGVTDTLDAGEVLAEAGSIVLTKAGGANLDPVTHYVRARTKRGATFSSWSATLTLALVPAADTTPDAFSFTDQTEVAVSTVTTSAPITVSGINTPTAISVTGGQYNINGGTFVSTAGTVVNGDQVRARATSAGVAATDVNVVVTIGGVSDTFTISTVSGAGGGGDVDYMFMDSWFSWEPGVTGADSPTFNFEVNLGTAAADRVVIVTLQHQNNNYPFTCSIEGTSIPARATVATDGTDQCQIFSGLLASGSGSQTVSITGTGSDWSERFIGIWVAHGINPVPKQIRKAKATTTLAIPVVAGDLLFVQASRLYSDSPNSYNFALSTEAPAGVYVSPNTDSTFRVTYGEWEIGATDASFDVTDTAASGGGTQLLLMATFGA